MAALIVVSDHRTWELYPDAAGYLGGVRRGKNESVMFVRDIDKLALPADIERELRVFHELATGDSGGTDAEYASLLHELDKLSEPDFQQWAVGLAARLDESLGDDWTVRLSDRW